MDFDENIYALIDRYLNNELKGQELKAFEIRKKTDAAFAQEVEMSASMKDFLSDSPENDLRRNLQELNEQFVLEPEKPKEKSGFFVWLDNLINEFTSVSSPLKLALYLIPILFLAGWWWFRTAPVEPVIVHNPPVIDTLKTNPVVDPEQEVFATPEQPIVEEPQNQDAIKKKKEVEQKKPDSRKLYAANYTPNPTIDFLIDNNLRSNDISFEIKNKMQSAIIKKLEDAVPFNIAGTFSSKENLLEKEFKVHLFSNDKSQYDDFQPLNSSTILLQKIADNTFEFDLEKYIVLKPGLYYYLLDDASERVHFVEKFEVRL